MEVENTQNNLTSSYSGVPPTQSQFSFSNPNAQKKRQVVELEQFDVCMDDGQINSEVVETQADPEGFFADTKTAAACSVRVALRVRPLIGRELYESPTICIQCYPEVNQMIIGKDRAFTFDKVFDIGTRQKDVFDTCVKNLVLGCFQGYNATVLAYGQTGSGKTHTMGSGYTIGLKEEELGIIPRVIKLIFDEVDKRKQKAEFIIKCTFLEIYNEELHDLLDHGSLNSLVGSTSSASAAVMDRFMQKKEITIREEKNGNISVYGLREEKVNCYEELAACLDRGSNFRSTASTLMNNCSSRSHAIFTISIEQHVIEDLYKVEGTPQVQAQQQNSDSPSEEFMVAKFHFVDLAGSERAKRTGATGNTLKEGISINKGLLALGNVISALTEEGKKMHVPYRDSKLTRILQDSLGGNSRTSMIACVSPAEINFEETLNTLKYASRARNIKNKPIVNRDPNSAQIAQLRQQVYELQRELAGCRKILVTNNIEFDQVAILPSDAQLENGPDGGLGKSMDTNHTRQYALGAKEIQRLEDEIKELKIEKSQKDKKNSQLQIQNESYKEQMQSYQLESFQYQKERDIVRFSFEQMQSILKSRGILNEVMNEMNNNINGMRSQEQMDIDEISESKKDDQQIMGMSSGFSILEEYQLKAEQYKKELSDKTQQVKQLQNDYELLFEQQRQDQILLENKEKEIEKLKRSVNKFQKENIQIRNDMRKNQNLRPNTAQNFQQPVQQQIMQSAHKSTFAAAAEKRNQTPFISQTQKKKSDQFQNNLIKQRQTQQEWIPSELDYNIKNFNDLFIDTISQTLSTMMISKKPNPSTAGEEMKKGEKQQVQSIEEQENDQDSESDNDNSEDEEAKKEAENEEEQLLNIDEEAKIKAQQEAIENNEENRKRDEQMKQNIQSHEQQVFVIEGELKDKEAILEAVKESHKQLQNKLLQELANEYHKKIQEKNNDILHLEKEKNEALKKADSQVQKNNIEEQYKKRMKELENQLSEMKKKDNYQNQIQKEADKQKQKIKTLEEEIGKVKNQKVSLMKKIKLESDEHRKWKNDKGMELIKVKQANLKKDREIQKLKRENQRKDMLAKRKQDEFNALQKKTKADKQKQINAEKQRQKKKNIDMTQIRDWILSNTEKMVRQNELSQQIAQESQYVKEIEDQISEEQGQLAALNIQREKLEIKKGQLTLQENSEGDLYLINEQLESLGFECDTISGNIESLEEKQDYINSQISKMNTDLIEIGADNIQAPNFDSLQSIDGAKACIQTFFQILLGANVTNKQLENQLVQNEATIDTLKQYMEELTNIQKGNEISFQKQLEDINREYSEKEELMMRIIMENGGMEIAEQIGYNNDGLNRQGSGNSTEIFRQYLKSKENEILEQNNANGSNNLGSNNLSHQNSLGPQRKGTGNTKAVDAMKKNKEQQYNQSKTQLSKRVAEQERKIKDDEKKFENMRHKFEQTNQEKELYKRQVENLKQKLKMLEIQDVKNSKIVQEDPLLVQNNSNGKDNLTKSPRQLSQQQSLVVQDKKQNLITLHDMRNQRKIKKMGNTNQEKQNKNNEPKVIADEPMEDEEAEQQEKQDSPSIQISHIQKVDNQQRRSTQMGDNIIAGVSKNEQYILKTNTSTTNNEGFDQSQAQSQNVFSRLSQYKGRTANTASQNNSQSQVNITNYNSSIMSNQQQQQTFQQQQQQQNNEFSNGYDDDHKWKCLISKELAHSGQICALTSVGNQLYSTSNKSLKIWDLDTMTQVSDIQAHQSFIKCMTIWENKNLLLTASDKVIMLWDLISLTNVGQLKGHKDEIRALNVSQDGHILFSAGKGSQNGGALLLWDLRKGASPLEEKEKQQDIFSLASTKEHLFFGCRNHQVYPMNLKNTEILHPFEPPHFDVVTSLSILDNTLVSGSRDKNLRCWDYSNLQNKYSDVMQAHSDWINAMETDCDKKEMYSGGKDGVVKVWKIKKKKLKCMAALSSNSGSINCLSKIDKQFGKMFALGCSDKSIRMWKFKEKYLNEQSDSSPDQNAQQYYQDQEYFQQAADQQMIDVNQDYNEEEDNNQEIDNQIFTQIDKKEEQKQMDRMQANFDSSAMNTTYQQKYQPVRQAVSSIGGGGSSQGQYQSVTTLSNPSQKLQQMRRQKRLQENQKRQQKENDVFQRQQQNE